MLEEMLMNVVQAMSNCLDEEQLDKLQNVLYIQFHDKKLWKKKTSCRQLERIAILLKSGCLLPVKKYPAGRTIHWPSM